ncbi:MAG: hypothetical protein HY064_07480 [Bacteroidetes bacterium]|nr:hypothetical protein [Bacteroidota bacterium]
MKRVSTLFLLFLFSIVSVSAQVDVTWGIPQKQLRKTRLNNLLGHDDAYVYAVRADLSLFATHEPIVERYKLTDMGLDYSKTIQFSMQGRTMDVESLFLINKKILAFGSLYDKEKNVNVLYAEVLDNTCTVEKAWMQIASVNADKKNNSGSFFAAMSDDSLHILIVINPPYDKAANENYTLQLLDSDLKTEWKKEIAPPYLDQYFALDNFIVSKKGDVYMLATISKDKSVMSPHERRTLPTYYNSVLLYDRAADALQEFKVNLDPKFISDVKIAVNDSGDIICAGFYSNKSSFEATGTFYLKIDRKTKAVVTQGTMDFSKDFLEQFMSPQKAAHGKELPDYDLRYLVQRDDGGAILVAEQYYEVLVQSYDPTAKMYTYTYYYYYNEIIVVSIDPDGGISWAKKIPKYQVSRNDVGYYSSFAFAVSGDKMYFMFNDNPKNLKLKDKGRYKYLSNPKRSVATLVTMDSRGNQDRQAMFNNNDLKIILRPKLFLQCNEHELILYGEKGSTFKLANVKIE